MDTAAFDQLDFIKLFTPAEYGQGQDAERRPERLFGGRGRVPEYRARLITTSKKVIPKKLIYVGCFADATAPAIEFRPEYLVETPALPWQQFHETIEERIIKRYFPFG